MLGGKIIGRERNKVWISGRLVRLEIFHLFGITKKISINKFSTRCFIYKVFVCNRLGDSPSGVIRD